MTTVTQPEHSKNIKKNKIKLKWES